MNISIAHLQGGEVSGSIDESTRHAMSKYAHLHFPSTQRSAEYLIRMGERPDTILSIGCPSSDIARTLDRNLSASVVNDRGGGAEIDVNRPFLLVVFHPTTTEYGDEKREMEELLEALERAAMPTILLWPNIDAGSDHISKAVRKFRDQRAPSWLRTLINVTPENYLRILANAACAIGNSYSFVRDARFFRHARRVGWEPPGWPGMDRSVTPSVPMADDILAALRFQLAHGSYPPSKLYGDGYVSERIADRLARASLYVQKRLHFVYETERVSAVAAD